MRAPWGVDQRDATALLGYWAPIRKALWERITHLGAPRMMSYAWMMASLWLALLAFNKWGWRWSLVVGVLWAVVQSVLALLMYWNPQFDNAFCARWSRSYQPYYPPG